MTRSQILNNIKENLKKFYEWNERSFEVLYTLQGDHVSNSNSVT